MLLPPLSKVTVQVIQAGIQRICFVEVCLKPVKSFPEFFIGTADMIFLELLDIACSPVKVGDQIKKVRKVSEVDYGKNIGVGAHRSGDDVDGIFGTVESALFTKERIDIVMPAIDDKRPDFTFAIWQDDVKMQQIGTMINNMSDKSCSGGCQRTCTLLEISKCPECSGHFWRMLARSEIIDSVKFNTCRFEYMAVDYLLDQFSLWLSCPVVDLCSTIHGILFLLLNIFVSDIP